jgi:glucose-6-phosphate-specific signal transduction histidine kinase
MTDLFIFAFLFFGIGLMFFTFYFHSYLTAIISIPLWVFMAVGLAEYPLLIVVFSALALVNAFIAVAYIRND